MNWDVIRKVLSAAAQAIGRVSGALGIERSPTLTRPIVPVADGVTLIWGRGAEKSNPPRTKGRRLQARECRERTKKP